MPARGSRMFFCRNPSFVVPIRAATVMIRAKDGHQQWWGAAMWGICANDPFLDASWLQGVPPNLHMCFSFNREIIMLKHWAYQSEVARGSINLLCCLGLLRDWGWISIRTTSWSTSICQPAMFLNEFPSSNHTWQCELPQKLAFIWENNLQRWCKYQMNSGLSSAMYDY
jgi:hypothetical protein